MIADITTNYEPLYKQWYAKSYQNMFYRNHPLMAMMPKERAGGEQVKQSIKIAPGAGQGSTFANALANTSSTTRRAFLGDWGIDYSLAQVSNTLIQLSQNDKGVIMKALADETETCVQALGNKLELDLFRSGYGERGVISTVSTTLITLTSRSDSQNFWPGMVLVASTTLSTAVLLNSGASATVSAVDRDAGTLTSASNWATQIGAIAAGNYLFQQGDRQDSASPAALKVIGLSGWLPLTAPGGSDSFNGVNRSLDPVALAGVRVDGRGKPYSQAIYDLAVRIGENGGTPDTCFLAYDTFGKLAIELGNKVVYENVIGSDATGKEISVGFRSILVAGPNGPIETFSSTYCPMDRMFVLTKRDWTLYCGANTTDPMFPTLQNGNLLDVYNADAVQIRHKYLCQLMCSAPGHSGVTQIA